MLLLEQQDPTYKAVPGGNTAWRRHRGLGRARQLAPRITDEATDSAAIPRIVDSCPALRCAGVAKVFEGYLGSDTQYTKYLKIDIERFMVPQTALEQSVGDALILLHISSTTGDTQLFAEAQRRQVVGIQRLRGELAALKDSDGVLAAAQALLGCEFYSAVSNEAGLETWTSHVNGISAVLQAAESFRPAAMSDHRRFLLLQARHLTVIHSLVCRRVTPGLQYWQIDHESLLSGSTESLMRLALRLPPLLQSVDIIDGRHDRPVRDAMISTVNVHTSQKRLKARFLRWCEENDLNSLFWDDYTHATVYGNNSRPYVAQTALSFPSSFHATQLALYWTCLLLLHQAFLDINGGTEPTGSLSAEADWYADRLCASIPFLLESAHSPISKAIAVRGPLHFAVHWWSGRDTRKLQWCREVEYTLRSCVPYLNWDALLAYSFPAIYTLNHSS